MKISISWRNINISENIYQWRIEINFEKLNLKLLAASHKRKAENEKAKKCWRL